MNDANVNTHNKQYANGWGQRWPNESMITFFHRYIKKNLGGGRKVLEFGCGTGANLRVFKELGMDVYGIDTSREAIEFGVNEWGFNKYNFSDNNVLTSKSIKEIWNEKFSLIISLGTLPLFNDEELNILFSQMSDALEPNGKVLFNMFDYECGYDVTKMEDGYYLAKAWGTIHEELIFNLVNKKEMREMVGTYFNEIAVKETSIELENGVQKSIYFMGEKI